MCATAYRAVVGSGQQDVRGQETRFLHLVAATAPRRHVDGRARQSRAGKRDRIASCRRRVVTHPLGNVSTSGLWKRSGKVHVLLYPHGAHRTVGGTS